MDVRLCDRLRVLVNGVTEVGCVYNIQQNPAEEGKDYPSNEEAYGSQNCCLLQVCARRLSSDSAWTSVLQFSGFEVQEREEEICDTQ